MLELTNSSNSSTDLHEDNFTVHISLTFFSILTFLTNILVVNVILRFKHLRRRSSNKFLLNLMFSDVFVGVAMMVFSVSVQVLNIEDHIDENHREPPQIVSLMLSVLVLLSVMNLILLTGERVCAIKWTFRYFDVMTNRNICIVIISTWAMSAIYFITLIALIVAGSDSLTDIAVDIVYVSFVIFFFVGVLVLCISSILIYNEAHSQLMKIRKTSVVAPEEIKEVQKNFSLREARLALISIGLVVKFALFWSPLLAVMMYHLIWGSFVSTEMEFSALHLVLLNCLCDPTVYVFLSRDIRKAIQSMV